MEFVIEAEHLSKTYKTEGKKLVALDDLNLKIEKGQIFGFIGPNGAGKTTSIKLFLGLIHPTSGTVRVMGKPAGSPEAMEKIGYLSEIAYYYKFLEAKTLLKYYASLKMLSKEEAEKRIDSNLKLVGLYDRRNDKLKGYSKGMLQRFGIALSLLGNPELLILDEPTSGLDPIGRKEVKDIIKRLKSQGITIFLSSHNLSEVERLCDSIGIINKGKMVSNKKISDFLNYDKNVYTMTIQDKNKKVENILKGKNIKVEETEDLHLRITLPSNDIPEIFKLITSNEGIIVNTIPGYGDLEETFFNLIAPQKDKEENKEKLKKEKSKIKKENKDEEENKKEESKETKIADETSDIKTKKKIKKGKNKK